MNVDVMKERWNEVEDEIRTKWKKFSDDDLDDLKADPRGLAGKLQRIYSYSREEADMEAQEFLADLEDQLVLERENMSSFEDPNEDRIGRANRDDDTGQVDRRRPLKSA